jgi:hypothetical protein
MLFAAVIGLDIGGAEAVLWFDYVLTPLAAGLACALCWRAGARHEGRVRLFWSLLACAAAAWTLGESIWGYDVLILGVTAMPVPSWADAGYLTAVPLTVAALAVHPATTATTVRRARWLLEGLIMATALLFVSWTLALGPTWYDSNLGTWSGIVSLAYPFGDVVIVFFVVLGIRGMGGEDRWSQWCLLSALLAMSIADSTTFSYVAAETYTVPALIDTGWFAAYLGIALAAATARPGPAPVRTAATGRPSLAALVTPLVAVIVALTVAAVRVNLGESLDGAGVIMALVLIVLVLAGQMIMVVEVCMSCRRGQGGVMQRATDQALGRPGT